MTARVLKVGLALGGGGARGLAHICMLEVLDELGVRPHCIAGTSIGAVLGAVYASGVSGKEIREHVGRLLAWRGKSWRQMLKRRDVLQWVKLLDVERGRGGLLKGDRFFHSLYDALGVSTFEELKIPLKVVCTDFWKSEQVVFESGDLLPAVKASMGLPGVFTPVTLDGRVLIDGGGVNPVPHDVLQDCDVIVAVDVMGRMVQDPKRAPNLFRVVLGMFEIMQRSIVAGKNRHLPPTLYIRPDIAGVDILEFSKADLVYAQAEPECLRLRASLEQLLKSGDAYAPDLAH